MKFVFKLLIASISGIALSFALAPYNLWFLIFPCFGVFYYIYQTLEIKKQVFVLSFLFALGYFIAGLYWIGNALLVEGNEYKWAWPFAVIVLPSLLALFPALYLTINHLLFKNNTLSKFIGFCTLLAFSEWVRGHAFTGFPWNLYGYGAASNSNISQSLSLIGAYGLTLLTVFWGGSLGYLFVQNKSKYFIFALSVLTFTGLYAYGHQRLENANIQYNEDYQIHVVQPNIEQSEKWQNDKLSHNFEQLISANIHPLAEDKKHIVIWPETAIPPILLNSPAVHQRINNMLGDKAILLSGALTMQAGSQSNDLEYNNALLLWNQLNQGKQIYAKSHLVPFGEYIPFQKYIPLETVTQFSGFQRGKGSQTTALKGFPSFSPLICYEIIFPHKVINKGAPRPDYILTVTNDGWYGDSTGPYQHLAQARFRAIEHGIPVIRSANTGVSAVVDPYGNVLGQVSLLKKGRIASKLPKLITKSPVYSRYGELFYFMLSGFLLLLATAIFKKN